MSSIISRNGSFHGPTLALSIGIVLAAPAMLASAETLEEVLEHYDSGGHPSPTVHPLIRPLHLTTLEKQQIISFLHTLTDTAFVENADFGSPYLISRGLPIPTDKPRTQ